MDKLKLGMYWGAGCGGCDIALLEIHEQILDVLSAADIVFWPCVADFKYKDVEAMPDGALDVCLFSGSIRNEENAKIARLLRRKSAALVAFGACAMMGGIPGLGNFFTREDIFERAYSTSESTDNPSGTAPHTVTELGNGKSINLPAVNPKVKALHQIVRVDYFMPGCPPAEKQVAAVCQALARRAMPIAPAILGAGGKSVCDECALEKTGRKVKSFTRPHQTVPDGTTCLLEQGFVCMGPATRSGCEARCTTVNMPCRGCYGPAGNSVDQAAKMVSAIASVIDSEDEQEIRAAVAGVVDPAGTFYSFSLPVSILKRSRDVSSKATDRQPNPSSVPAEGVTS